MILDFGLRLHRSACSGEISCRNLLGESPRFQLADAFRTISIFRTQQYLFDGTHPVMPALAELEMKPAS